MTKDPVLFSEVDSASMLSLQVRVLENDVEARAFFEEQNKAFGGEYYRRVGDCILVTKDDWRLQMRSRVLLVGRFVITEFHPVGSLAGTTPIVAYRKLGSNIDMGAAWFDLLHRLRNNYKRTSNPLPDYIFTQLGGVL